MTPPADPTDPHPRSCLSCGQPARWLVVAPYDPSEVTSDAPSGRLLVYCDQCRRDTRETGADETGADETGPRYSVVLPIKVLDVDAEATLRLLYGAGLTVSDPEQVREHLAVHAGEWLRFAHEQVEAFENG